MQEKVFKREMKLMGCRFGVTVVAESSASADHYIASAVREMERIERLLTTFSEDSDAARVNAGAGLWPVKVSPETFELIKRSIRISALTRGAFDITYGAVDKRLWNFDTTMSCLPDAATARNTVRLI